MILLITYCISLIITSVFIYVNMEKGESLEDYIYRTDNLALFIIMFIPAVNYLAVIYVLIYTIWNKLKHFTK